MDYILDTKVSIKTVKHKLLEYDKNNHKADKKSPSPKKNTKPTTLQSYSSELISEKDGFSSDIIRINLGWNEKNSSLPRKIVIKYPTELKFNELKNEVLPTAADIPEESLPLTHQNECNFYSLWSKSNPSPFSIPKCYFTEPDISKGPVLAFEDLSDELAMQDVGEGLSVPQLMQIGEELAGLHAWCLTNQGWEEKFPGIPANIWEIFAHAPIYDAIARDFPNHFNLKKLQAMKKYCQSTDDITYLDELHKELNMPPVLVHGDLWANNIMFKKTTGKDGKTVASDKVLAIFDWQTCNKGCASIDFARLACSSMTTSVRREKMEAIMQHYYATLRHKLGKEPPFSFETLMKGYFKSMKAQTNVCFWFLLLFKSSSKETIGESSKEQEDEFINRFVALLDDTLSILEPDAEY